MIVFVLGGSSSETSSAKHTISPAEDIIVGLLALALITAVPCLVQTSNGVCARPAYNQIVALSSSRGLESLIAPYGAGEIFWTAFEVHAYPSKGDPTPGVSQTDPKTGLPLMTSFSVRPMATLARIVPQRVK